MAQLKLFGSARGGARVAKHGKREKPARQKKPLKALAIVLTVLLCLEGLYFLCIYSNIPFIVKYRTIYINTAMNTMSSTALITEAMAINSSGCLESPMPRSTALARL